MPVNSLGNYLGNDLTNKIVSIDNIDLSDETYRITTNKDIAKLKDSIESIGLINFPILKPLKTNFIVLSGFKRILACQELGMPKIDARIVDKSQTKLFCIKRVIADNAYQRPLNLIEQSRSIAMLLKYLSEDEILNFVKSLPNFVDNLGLLRKIKFLNLLPKAISDKVIDDTISLTIAYELSKLDKELGCYFAKIFHDLALSLSKQKEILTYVKEISHLEDIDMSEVINDTSMKTILLDKNIDRTQKTQKLRKILRQRRYPTIVDFEQKYNQLLKSLDLKNKLQLIAPKDFEGNDFSIKMTFKSFDELLDQKQIFDSLVKNQNLKKIINKEV